MRIGTANDLPVTHHALEINGIQASMSRPGNCYDNAVMESFFSSLKTELVHHESFQNPDQARTKVFEWIEVFYNRQRGGTRR